MSVQTITSYNVHEGAEGLAALKSAWESLEATGADHIFQTYAHADIWQRTVGAPSRAKPLIVTLSEAGRVVGIFPACRVRQSGVPILTWLGAPRVLDYGDVIFDADVARTTIDDFVAESLRLLAKRARGSVLYLTNVREDARVFPALASRLRVLRESAAPYVPISGTWEEYLVTRGRGLRRALKRQSRNLTEQGCVNFALLGPGDPEVVPALDRLMAFQRARFTGVFDRTHLYDPAHVAFRREQAAEPHSRIATLSFEGEYIAVCLGSLYRGRYYFIVAGFDQERAAYSPGLVLLGFGIRACYENGWDTCDLCWGDEPYKYQWTDAREKLTTFVGRDLGGAGLTAVARLRHGVIAMLDRARKKPGRSDGRATE